MTSLDRKLTGWRAGLYNLARGRLNLYLIVTETSLRSLSYSVPVLVKLLESGDLLKLKVVQILIGQSSGFKKSRNKTATSLTIDTVSKSSCVFSQNSSMRKRSNETG